MNDRSIIESPEPRPRQNWVDAYMPEGYPPPAQPSRKLIDLAAIRGILYRQRWLFVGVILLALIVGLIVTLLATPMYAARASVQIDPYGQYIVEGQDIETPLASNQVYSFLQTQVAVIESRKLAEIVVANLGLGERAAILGEDFDEGRPPNVTDAQWAETRARAAAERIQSQVDANLPEDNWIIEIIYRSSDRVLAAELANAYTDAFADSDTRADLETNEYAREYLEGQIQQVRAKLEDAEQAANTYARNSEIIMEPGLGPGMEAATLTAANLSAINGRVTEARAQRIAAEQRWRSVQGLPAGQLPEAQSNSVLQTLIGERTKLRTELVELRQRYDDNFPQIQNVLRQIAILEAQIEESAAEIKAGIRNNYIIARNQEAALTQELNSLTGETLAERDDEVQLGFLEREASALSEQLQTLLNRYNQISSATNVDTGSFTKLDGAIVPRDPYAPSLLRNMTLALVIGVALAGGLAVLRETFDDRIRSLDEVEDKLGVPLLGQTPYVDESDIDVTQSQFSALMEAYASIRSTIDFSLPRDRNVLQCTSTEAAEGKSTTIVILAELFARMGRKTLLIDGDFRRPSIAKLLNLEKPKVGFAEVLLGHAKFEDALIRGVHDNLDILPIAETPTNPSELFSEENLRDFIAARRDEYSLVLFDSSPVLGLADAPMLARAVDATVFVMEANRIQFGKVKTAMRRLESGGGKLLGVVLTKFRALEAGQDYNYQYAYYQYGDD
ncbi:MAG: polysaccharide biosynthesis tyrosine autokinase [Erythrobacter sp.]|jgi:capsular exopolysaccharide synthesis family protein|nr:polysaccharide biosynthesis tyrosine autokinase [Erythrobacter sp.]